MERQKFSPPGDRPSKIKIKNRNMIHPRNGIEHRDHNSRSERQSYGIKLVAGLGSQSRIHPQQPETSGQSSPIKVNQAQNIFWIGAHSRYQSFASLRLCVSALKIRP
jgi:hypothetical protein